MKSPGKVKKPNTAGPVPAPPQCLRMSSSQLFAPQPEEERALAEQPLPSLGAARGHHFGEVALTPPQSEMSSAFYRLHAGTCPLATPRTCPFGGACHTCPVAVQAKLAISQPGDQHEQEADRVAEEVLRRPNEQVLQRQCLPCGENEDEDEVLPGKKLPGLTPAVGLLTEVPPLVQEVIRSPGQPLDPLTREFMESRFGHDFSQVRVHTDAQAAFLARQFNAQALTVGRNVVFGEGQYAPATTSGRLLLAHELTHVVQQGGDRLIHLDRQNDTAEEMERSAKLALGYQPHYGVLEEEKRTPMAITTGNQEADEILWTFEAFNKADKMRAFLQTFGPERDLRVTSIVKPGEHTKYRKMDVVPAGRTSWEELAAAAGHAGFWVHAEGIELGKKFWPLSQKATGPHLDLYLILRVVGDFPIPAKKEQIIQAKTNGALFSNPASNCRIDNFHQAGVLNKKASFNITSINLSHNFIIMQRNINECKNEATDKPKMNKLEITDDLKKQMIATILSEAAENQEFDISWIYYNIITTHGEKGLERSSAFKFKGDWFKVWMTALEYKPGENTLGDTSYGRDKPNPNNVNLKNYETIGAYVINNEWFRKKGPTRIQKVKKIIEEIFENPEKNPYPGWEGQGSLNDINREDSPWKEARMYLYLQEQYNTLEKYVKVLEAGKFTSFIFNSKKILEYFKNNPKQKEKLKDVGKYPFTSKPKSP